MEEGGSSSASGKTAVPDASRPSAVLARRSVRRSSVALGGRLSSNAGVTSAGTSRAATFFEQIPERSRILSDFRI